MEPLICDICMKLPAVITITAADADGFVLDRVIVCAQPGCIAASAHVLVCGTPTKPIKIDPLYPRRGPKK